MKTRMFPKKAINRFSLMPPGSIPIEPDCIASEAPREMTKDFHKAFPIPSGRADNPITSQKRSHPTRKIKSLIMLTGRRDTKRMSHLRPSPSQPRMQSESCLILEDDCLPRPQILKFFLSRSETVPPLPFGPEDMYNWPVLNDIPTDASSFGLAGLSFSNHIGALSVPPESGRPNALDSTRTLEEIAPNGPRPARQSEELIEKAFPVESCPLKLLNPSHLQRGPIDLDSFGSNPKRPQSTPAFDLPRSREGQRSLALSLHRESPWQKPRDDLWRHRDE